MIVLAGGLQAELRGGAVLGVGGLALAPWSVQRDTSRERVEDEEAAGPF